MHNQLLSSYKQIGEMIFHIRGQKVMIDHDLAKLYGVKTYRLNEQVKRNMKRFPDDFLFKINNKEKHELIANCDRLQSLKHSTSNPYAFTEHGILMLSSVLNSDRAIEVNIQIMRTFAKLRELMLVHKDLRTKIEKLEKKYDSQFQVVFNALRKLIDLPPKPKRPIGNHAK